MGWGEGGGGEDQYCRILYGRGWREGFLVGGVGGGVTGSGWRENGYDG